MRVHLVTFLLAVLVVVLAVGWWRDHVRLQRKLDIEEEARLRIQYESFRNQVDQAVKDLQLTAVRPMTWDEALSQAEQGAKPPTENARPPEPK